MENVLDTAGKEGVFSCTYASRHKGGVDRRKGKRVNRP